MILDDSQRAALVMASREPLCIITGGPGTGKTTILRELLDHMDRRVASEFQKESDRGLYPPYLLAAPTGKAAKRMSEATGREAVTIHRMLGYQGEGQGWRHGYERPLQAQVVIVDEASMIDVSLFAGLVEAIDERTTRLVLVGDANQLPSVGPGSVLADLVESGLVPCARLTTVHRSAAGSWICRNAPRILGGDPIDLEDADVDGSPVEDFEFAETTDEAEDILRACREVASARSEIQFLLPQKTGRAGADAINAALQKHLNPRASRPASVSWGKPPHRLYVGDRVIHTRNDYDLGVMNGETGIVTDVGRASMGVDFGDRAVVYDRHQSNALRLAYALTIHKSQGSEWPWVAVVVHSTHTYMLTRQLLYTAVTRGKAGVVIVGNAKGVKAALKCKRDASRNTALADRIRGELK